MEIACLTIWELLTFITIRNTYLYFFFLLSLSLWWNFPVLRISNLNRKLYRVFSHFRVFLEISIISLSSMRTINPFYLFYDVLWKWKFCRWRWLAEHRKELSASKNLASSSFFFLSLFPFTLINVRMNFSLGIRLPFYRVWFASTLHEPYYRMNVIRA